MMRGLAQIAPDGSTVAFVRVTVNEKENRCSGEGEQTGVVAAVLLPQAVSLMAMTHPPDGEGRIERELTAGQRRGRG